jgi:hypothetical protein
MVVVVVAVVAVVVLLVVEVGGSTASQSLLILTSTVPKLLSGVRHLNGLATYVLIVRVEELRRRVLAVAFIDAAVCCDLLKLVDAMLLNKKGIQRNPHTK